jgi:hypothetical protein
VPGRRKRRLTMESWPVSRGPPDRVAGIGIKAGREALPLIEATTHCKAAFAAPWCTAEGCMWRDGARAASEPLGRSGRRAKRA